MSLSRRLLLLIATLVTGLLLIAAAALWGVASLNRNLTAALGAYDRLRVLYDVGVELTRVDQWVRAHPDASQEADLRLLGVQQQVMRIDDAELRDRLSIEPDGDKAVTYRINDRLNVVMGAVAQTRQRIRQIDADARAQRRQTLIAMAGLSVLTLVAVGLAVRRQLVALDDQVRAKSAELARAERLASVGFLAAGVAHEINNPLGIIAGEAELAVRRADSDAQRHTLEVIRDEAFRGKAITTRLLSLARADAGDARPIDLSAVARDVVAVVGRMDRFKSRRVDLLVENTHVVLADQTLITQVVLNLVINALEATDASTGHVAIEVRDGALDVIDNGRGLTREEISRVFEPFYTSKRGESASSDVAPGYGLGLSISHAIVQRFAGRLNVTSAGPGQGCRFTLELPRATT